MAQLGNDSDMRREAESPPAARPSQSKAHLEHWQGPGPEAGPWETPGRASRGGCQPESRSQGRPVWASEPEWPGSHGVSDDSHGHTVTVPLRLAPARDPP